MEIDLVTFGWGSEYGGYCREATRDRAMIWSHGVGFVGVGTLSSLQTFFRAST